MISSGINNENIPYIKIPIFLSFGGAFLNIPHPLVRTFTSNPAVHHFKNILNINDINNTNHELKNILNNNNRCVPYAILFHNSVDRLKGTNLEIVLKCMTELCNKNVPYYHFVLENSFSIHTELQPSLSQINLSNEYITRRLLCNSIWKKKQEKMRTILLNNCEAPNGIPIRIYPYLHGTNPLRPRVMPTIRDIIFSDIEQRQWDFERMNDVTFVPQLRRFWMEKRYCTICGANSHTVKTFYKLSSSTKLQTESFLCDKCYSSPPSGQRVEFFDCESKDTVKKCFDFCYVKKDYAKALTLIPDYREHDDYENEVLFMFMKVKILKHKEAFKEAIEYLTECRKRLKEITTQESEFRTYFGIVLSYEEALLYMIASKLDQSQEQFRKVKMDCQEFSKKQNQKFTGGKMMLSQRERHIMLIKCYALNFLAYIYRQQNNRKKALKSLLEIKRCVEQFELNDVIIVNACQHDGIIAFENGNPTLALTKLHEAIEMLYKYPLYATHKNRIQAELLLSIAELSLNMEELKNANNAIQPILKVAETTPDYEFRNTCWKIYGKILLSMGQYGKSIKFLNKSLDICHKYNYKYKFAIVDEVLHLIGINFYKLGKNENAMKCYQKALEIAENNKNTLLIDKLKLSIADLSIMENELKEAEKH